MKTVEPDRRKYLQVYDAVNPAVRVRLPVMLRNELQRVADEEGVPASHWVVDAIVQKLATGGD